MRVHTISRLNLIIIGSLGKFGATFKEFDRHKNSYRKVSRRKTWEFVEGWNLFRPDNKCYRHVTSSQFFAYLLYRDWLDVLNLIRGAVFLRQTVRNFEERKICHGYNHYVYNSKDPRSLRDKSYDTFHWLDIPRIDRLFCHKRASKLDRIRYFQCSNDETAALMVIGLAASCPGFRISLIALIAATCTNWWHTFELRASINLINYHNRMAPDCIVSTRKLKHVGTIHGSSLG